MEVGPKAAPCLALAVGLLAGCTKGPKYAEALPGPPALTRDEVKAIVRSEIEAHDQATEKARAENAGRAKDARVEAARESLKEAGRRVLAASEQAKQIALRSLTEGEKQRVESIRSILRTGGIWDVAGEDRDFAFGEYPSVLLMDDLAESLKKFDDGWPGPLGEMLMMTDNEKMEIIRNWRRYDFARIQSLRDSASSIKAGGHVNEDWFKAWRDEPMLRHVFKRYIADAQKKP
jgi:hypothetical protein